MHDFIDFTILKWNDLYLVIFEIFIKFEQFFLLIGNLYDFVIIQKIKNNLFVKIF